ncbi:hypothetical protein Q75_06660 [Bacillus coahuilensis p1.1.43]|uniref:Uncharacterized protein n=1 Tax=Bacillus coahuilensis p1.1.43 TaxID=1150625 RepID=A0A147K9D3_9BACI|nr:hypothetical protein [Bacillus coahuilensis]KUP06891.1 hypothetical protein Q75_06660 [Bacillus coahuilensis p1.1.43]
MIAKLILYYVIIAAVSFLDYKYLGMKNQKNALYIYIIILLITSVLFTVHTIGVTIPNPLIGLRYIFEPVGKIVEKGLGVDTG